MRAARLLALAVVFALLPAGSATAGTLEGGTAQGKEVTLRVAREDTVSSMKIFWRATKCERPGFSMRTVRTFMLPPLDRSKPGFFADRGQYRVRYSDARVRFRIGSRGRMVSEKRWKGTFTATAFLIFNDGSKTTCRLRRIGWHAET